MTPIITLEGATELLLTVNSDLKGCMVKMAAKDAVDAMAGTPEMLERVQKNHDDPHMEPFRKSCKARDAMGDGKAKIGEDVPMGGMAMGGMGAAISASAINEKALAIKNMMDIEAMQVERMVWKAKGEDYYNMKMMEHLKWKNILHLQEVKSKETNQEARNMLEEKYVQECKSYVYPSITHPDRPETDYKTIEEYLMGCMGKEEIAKYANPIGRMMADQYRRNHNQQDPPVRVMPNGQRHKKYLQDDFKHIQCFIDHAIKDAEKPAHLQKGQQTILRHLSQHDGI